MTDKPIRIKNVRLSYAAIGPTTPREYAQAYRAFVEYSEKDMEVARVLHDLLPVIQVCGYNPQRLLTDQRSALKRFMGDVLGQPYDPDIRSSLLGYAYGGTLTGRAPGREPLMQDMPMGNEFVWPKWKPGDRIPHLFPGTKLHMAPDYSGVEDRVIGWGIRDRVESIDLRINVDTKAFEKQMRLVMAYEKIALDHAINRMVLKTLIRLPEPLSRERRILRLLRSKDPRQRKRGDRLYWVWDKSRPGYNPYRKD